MEFAEACSEVDFILTNLNPEDKKKVPNVVIEFFKENKSMFYKVNLTTTKPLANQVLKDETKAFLQILNYKYFANQKQKEEFKELFIENKNSDQLFTEENLMHTPKENILSAENDGLDLIIYKESKFKTLINKILSFFRK